MQKTPGQCTVEGTQRYRERLPNLAADHFSLDRGRWLSSVGLGTYAPTTEASTMQQVSAAIQFLAMRGCNLIDTAPNYGDGDAERGIGDGLAQMFADKRLRRDEVFVATKAGLVPEFLIEALESGHIAGLNPTRLGPDGVCFDPVYLRWQVNASRERLGLETLDCLFLHNFDALCLTDGQAACHRAFAQCVEVLEDLVQRGWLAAYGVSAWHGFRRAVDARDFLCLNELCTIVHSVAGPDGHFRFIQVPIGLWAPEAILLLNQRTVGADQPRSLLHAAHDLKLAVIANGSLLQGQLVGTPVLHEDLGLSGLIGPLQAIQFSRSIPGVMSVLVGMKNPQHWSLNASLFKRPKTDLASFGLTRKVLA